MRGLTPTEAQVLRRAIAWETGISQPEAIDAAGWAAFEALLRRGLLVGGLGAGRIVSPLGREALRIFDWIAAGRGVTP